MTMGQCQCEACERTKRAELVQLLRDLTDPNPCRLDHHGYCQEHAWLTDERPCPHARGKRLLEAVLDGIDRPHEQAKSLLGTNYNTPPTGSELDTRAREV